MITSYLLFIVVLQYATTAHQLTTHINVTTGKLGKRYNGTVANGNEDIYHYSIPNLRADSTVRVSVNSTNVNEETPLLFVARLTRGVTSWTVPFIAADGNKYSHVSQTLCPTLNDDSKNETQFEFYLDVSTSDRKGKSYSFVAHTDEDFVLNVGPPLVISANPAEPQFFTYTFHGNQESVLVKAESEDGICAVLMVQNTRCPSVYEKKGDNEYPGVFATMTEKAAITVERYRIPSDKFYVALSVKDTDHDCTFKSGRINPFLPNNDESDATVLKKQLHKSSNRKKILKISVEDLPRIDEYIGPVVAPLAFFGSFYIIALIILVVSWCMAEDGGRSFYTYLFPSKVEDKPEEEGEGNEQERLLRTPNLINNGMYGARGSSEIPEVTTTVTPDQVDEIDAQSLNSHHSNSEEFVDYDYLDDIEHNKDIYRLKTNLYLSDVSKKSYKKLQKKFNVYYWNLVTVSVFYALPVIQLVLTYQRVVNVSGDQDICYYNFFCARSYHLVSAFNNIYSNIGYMMLGLLFVFLVMRRDRLAKLKYAKNRSIEQSYGIPKHYGIMYAMGYALFMEGVMSACYHVCPNYSNFQFDTAFMYMIGMLGCLRIYQTRHHDVFLNGHFAYAGFAAVIFTAVIGVIFRSWQFWVVFLILHIASCFYISCQIYYMGRVKAAFKMHWLATQRRFWCSKPVYTIRFFLLLIFNVVNWALSINGLVNIPKDFATYLLGIIICNGLLYVGFYVVMKLRNGERITLLPLISIVLSLVVWGVSISFFVKGLTDWQTSPAQSREGNKECRLVNFYDDHDLWHFLSAMALFFSFVAVLTLDDDLDNKDRSTIAVF